MYTRKCWLTIMRSYFHLKNLGVLFFIPIIILNIIIPILNYLTYRKYGIGESLYVNILQYSQWFMPIISIWWPMFALRDYIEGDGNELLFSNPNRNKIIDMLCLFLFSILNILIIFLFYYLLMPDTKYEVVRIISICVFYFAIVYCISFLTKSTTIVLMLVIALTTVNVYLGGRVKTNIFINYSIEHLTLKSFINIYLPIVIIGFVLLVIGIILNKKLLRFNLGE